MFLVHRNFAKFSTVKNVAAIDDRRRVVSVREGYSCALILYYTALGFAARFLRYGYAKTSVYGKRAEYEIPRLFCFRSEIGISSDVAIIFTNVRTSWKIDTYGTQQSGSLSNLVCRATQFQSYQCL